MAAWDTLLRLAVASALGGLVGFERYRSDKAAGLRTHMLVSLGACLVMIVSAYGFYAVIDERRIVLDPSRIAAQVVSGIGFLGAGMILRKSDTVLGLTTAASTWAVAAVGLAAGAGLYVAAVGGTGMILVVLTAIKRMEDRLPVEPSRRHIDLVVARKALGATDVRLLLEGTAMELRGFRASRVEGRDDECIAIELGETSDDDLAALVDRLREHPGVREVSFEGHPRP